ncbi:MAG: hypothetical protein COV74_03310 [Candidatus Omnitrophica bacterium CG11_big_fil_rev_8_21_14_0_20_45_26]|uniref:Type II secretion system protein J n=1 Tax=Candidatus Abzuiibacterium crystallinum TaxID=1974748 RepID=A0A2H0LR00_9BACT|nr:MAG: hypothetical protein COV74_03310 [Candidatus Omnitrophica bacterium CG11_big_fil_rev_8_21_14_0_20_45_26]PIW64703.1 MAG: hypothetical protein COW12_05335 [Candidatus Omnitrophica bacterium CG12_big_fil_rev_8_21_14_0_65_45_16]
MHHLYSTRQGFTLIELMTGILLTALIGFAIYQALFQGMRLWHRTTQVKVLDELNFYIEELTEDVRNAVKYSTREFEGETDYLTFYSLQGNRINSNRHDVMVTGPSQVSYQYDVAAQIVTRKQDDYMKLLYNRKDAGQSRVVATHVVNQKLEYYYTGRYFSYEWRNHWKDSCFPRAIRIRLDYKEMNQTKTISRVIPITSGVCAV